MLRRQIKAGTTTGFTPIPAQELEKAKTVSEKPGASEIAAGKALFASQSCEGCHGETGNGESGDGFASFLTLPRAQSVTGVIEQLVEPIGGMPEYDRQLTLKKRNASGATCV